MGICNYCGHRKLKDVAANSGMFVTLLPTSFGLGGVDVFVHPPDVKIDALAVDEKHPHHQLYWKAWYMELSEDCVC